MTKEGYQPIKTEETIKITPPNTGSHVKMKGNDYTWKNVDKMLQEDFNTIKDKIEKCIAELAQENNAFKALRRYEGIIASAEIEKLQEKNEKLEEENKKAKEIIKKIEKIFYSGENAVKRLSEISDTLTEAEQFIKE